jgi:hypothetical protein
MKRVYLEINPEFFSSGIKFEFGEYLDFNQNTISNEIFCNIKDYNNKCLRYIRMNPNTQKLYRQEMFELDFLAWNLKSKIENAQDARVKVFSPFLLRYIFEKPQMKEYLTKDLTVIQRVQKSIVEFIYKMLGEASYGKVS